jgi:hypothetical protein
MSKLLPPKLFCCQNPIYETGKTVAMEVKSLFEKAVEESRALQSSPSKETSLRLYSLYMQATEGDVNT